MCVCNGVPIITKQKSIISQIDSTIEELIFIDIEIDTATEEV